MVGNAMGRTPYVYADGVEHHGNLFAVVVGDTARARKGTAAARIRSVMKDADPSWASKRIVNGLSSGEGLIFGVRDPICRSEPIKAKGKVVEYEEVMVDKGVDDKRLLAIESEFAQPLRVMRREGNTLSTTIRAAWDSGNLQTLTKNSPVQATDAHISIIGHITREELHRSLAAVDTSSGFANRFLWACATRARLLPHGGRVEETVILPLAGELADALTDARRIRRMGWGRKARLEWERIYADLGAPVPGVVGGVTSRAEPQVLRLALIYALLDKSTFIGLKHLLAAREVWRYCFDSARYVFAGVVGDPVGNPESSVSACPQAQDYQAGTVLSDVQPGQSAHGVLRGRRVSQSAQRAPGSCS
jgi:hypothetical protein